MGAQPQNAQIHRNQGVHQQFLPLSPDALFGHSSCSRSCARGDAYDACLARTTRAAARAQMPLTWDQFYAHQDPELLPPLSGRQADGDARKSVFMMQRQRGELTGTVHVEATFPAAQVTSAATPVQVLPGVPDVWTNTHSHIDVMRYHGVQRDVAQQPIYEQRLDQPQFSNGQVHSSSPRAGTAPTSAQQANLQQQPVPRGLAPAPVQTPVDAGPTMCTPHC